MPLLDSVGIEELLEPIPKPEMFGVNAVAAAAQGALSVPLWRGGVSSGLGWPAAQPPPLLDGKEHPGFHTALSHNLRPFGEGSTEKLAEPRLGILQRPLLAHALIQNNIDMTSHQTRHKDLECLGGWGNTRRRCSRRFRRCPVALRGRCSSKGRAKSGRQS